MIFFVGDPELAFMHASKDVEPRERQGDTGQIWLIFLIWDLRIKNLNIIPRVS